MASFDSPVYEHGEDNSDYPVAITHDDDIDSGIKDQDSPHSDTSTIEKKSDSFQQPDDDDDDDDEHEYTYPDGTGGTFDAPAPSAALITAPKTEDVMMTEVVIPDSRQKTSIPDYYKARSSKPYKFYGKFHSTTVVCKILGYCLLALILIATCTVLVLRVSVDHEFFQDDEESTTVPTPTQITSRFTSSISVLMIDGTALVFTEAFDDSESAEYKQLAMAVEESMDDIYSTGDLSDSYEGSKVTNIREGSVIVEVELIFKSTVQITSTEVEDEITRDLSSNNNVLTNIMVDPDSVAVSENDDEIQMSSTKPQTTVNPVEEDSTTDFPTTSTRPDVDSTITDPTKSITDFSKRSTTASLQPVPSTSSTTRSSQSVSSSISTITTQKSRSSPIYSENISFSSTSSQPLPSSSKSTTYKPMSSSNPSKSTTFEPMPSSYPSKSTSSSTTLQSIPTSSKLTTYQPMSSSNPSKETTFEPMATSYPSKSTTSQPLPSFSKSTTYQPMSTSNPSKETTFEPMPSSYPSKSTASSTTPQSKSTTYQPIPSPKSTLSSNTTSQTMLYSSTKPSSYPSESTTSEPMPSLSPSKTLSSSTTSQPMTYLPPSKTTTFKPVPSSSSPEGQDSTTKYDATVQTVSTTKYDATETVKTTATIEPVKTTITATITSNKQTPDTMSTTIKTYPPTGTPTGEGIPVSTQKTMPASSPFVATTEEASSTPVIDVNSTCAEKRDDLVKECDYSSTPCPWIYSCLEDGSWNPIQCFNDSDIVGCFCVEEDGTTLPETTTFDGTTPNCTADASDSFSSFSSVPLPVGHQSMTCSILQVKCKNGACVEFYQVGDGNDDCGDNSDEKFQDCGDTPFECQPELCVHSDFVCDGEPDCTNAKDEENCD
ncbi:uncharacterized protein [Antedon mediterranea]|uniref:uncharacterized protein isoform X2 n=1 Tax=Antedon mediterranea TaxID=105859 RepID=UPI003AF431A7